MNTESVNYFTKFEELFGKSDIDEVLSKDSDFYVEYVKTRWLDPYFKMKALAIKAPVPSITSTISDMPTSTTNANHSKTEKYALKAVMANDWLNHFHKNLDALPNEFKQIIEKKYLNRLADGRYPSDIKVYQELMLSRTVFYERKKQALEELGIFLYGSWSSN